MGLFDRFKKEKTVNDAHRDRSIADVRVPSNVSPTPSAPALHRIKMILSSFDNLDKIVRAFSITSFNGSDLRFDAARSVYYSDPSVFMHWRFDIPSVDYKETSSGFVFSCDSVRLGRIPKSSRSNSDFVIFRSLSDGKIRNLEIVVKNGEYFHLNKSQYENSKDFDPASDDPYNRGFPSWAKERVECYLNITVSYADYLAIARSQS